METSLSQNIDGEKKSRGRDLYISKIERKNTKNMKQRMMERGE